MKRLSSEIVIVYRWVYPFLFGFFSLLFFVAFSLGLMEGDHGRVNVWYAKWLALIAGGLATGFAIYQATIIQDVDLYDGKIRASGLRGTDEISLNDIESIRETRFRNPKLVILRLRDESRFGKTVMFIPRGKGEFLGTHPIVAELSAAVEKAKGRY